MNVRSSGFDGVSLSLLYDKGRFWRAATRGDGQRGDDVSENVKTIRGIPADLFVQTLEGDARALAKIEEHMRAWMTRMTDEGRPSTAQDVLKGRRTEIEFINGMVVEKGAEMGIPTPTQAAILALVKRVENGELPPAPENLAGI